MDVVVAGAGPAGWAVAGACARQGLRTELVDPEPDRPWVATYGAWRDEVTDRTLTAAVAAGGRAHAVGTTRHDLGWHYVVFDNGRLREHLAEPAVRVHQGRIAAATADPRGGATVTLPAGRIRAAVVIDATGPARAVLGGPPRPTPVEQTAVGVVVPWQRAAALFPRGEVLLMDWRADHGTVGWPTFLYGVPVGPDEVLLEETSLARRPGLPTAVLRDRLTRRLQAHGIDPTGAREEIVRFPVDTPVPRRRNRSGPIVPFGAAAPLIHPASGFSVAASLRLAPAVAESIRTGLDTGGPQVAARRAWSTVWSRSALAVHAMRTAGLRALLVMEPDAVGRFFDVFFELPERHRWAYLTSRDDVTGTAAAMAALFAASEWPLRRHLVVRGLDPRRPASQP